MISPSDHAAPSASNRVALVDLGRLTASGARQRIAGLARVLEAAGYEPIEVPVLPAFREKPLAIVRRMPTVLRARGQVPETLAWSPSRVRARLDQIDPCAVVCITSRCYHPDLVGPWHLVLDFVDRLSVSYADRARIASSAPWRWLYQVLARSQRRFEQHIPASVDQLIAAGRGDAQALGIHWLPITVDTVEADDTNDTNDTNTDAPANQPAVDLLFVGTLDYPPNVEAVEHLGSLWPAVLRRRPGTTALIAGARPDRRMTALANEHGWTLWADFPSAAEVYARGRVAVAPLLHASGMQIKALDAAAHGLPQIVGPVVADGLDPAFPLRICTSEAEWVDAIAELLDNEDRARALGQRAQAHVRDVYGHATVSARAVQLLTGKPNAAVSDTSS